MKYPFYFLTTAFLILNSCNNSSDVSEKKIIQQKTTCLEKSESELSGIVNGKKVKNADAETKDVLFILTHDEETGELQTCTASAIAPKVLITAAHCIGSVKNKTNVYFSRSAYCESGFNSEKQKKEVVRTILHPDYSMLDDDRTRSQNDLALIILAERIPNDYKIHSIATLNEGKNRDIEFLGYGVSQFNKDDALILRKITVDSSNIEIDNHHIYVHQKNGGICSGDSGGPGFVQVQNKKKILSINSMVLRPPGSNEDDFCQYEALLTPLEPHLDWILSSIKK